MKSKTINIKKITKIFFIILILFIICFWVLSPYYLMIVSSFSRSLFRSFVSSTSETSEWLAPNFTLSGYISALNNKDVVRSFINSLIVCSGTTLLSISISLFVAYALSRINFKWKKAYEIGLYTTQMFPSVALVVPFFVFYVLVKRYLGIPMKNTYHGLILTYTSFALPFSILMMRNYFLSIPKAFDEQAQIDGCSKFQIIYRVLIPMALPGIVTVAIFSFIMSWNEILFSSLLTNPQTLTISVLLISPRFITFSELFATSFLVTIPVVIIFTIMQKQLVSGLGKGIIKF